jgi:plastocyanin
MVLTPRTMALVMVCVTWAVSMGGQTPSVLHGRVEFRVAAGAETRPEIAEFGGRVPRPPERRRAVVYLETAPRAAFEAPASRRARMDQRNETFAPHVLAVTAGTTVDFPNSDPTYHNVFSLSRTKSFDLGRYAAGRSKAVVFDRPGIVRVFCDIHSHMNAWILVFAHRFFAITDDGGRYRIEGIPPGSYVVRIWSETHPTDSRSITIPPGTPAVELNLAIGREARQP